MRLRKRKYKYPKVNPAAKPRDSGRYSIKPVREDFVTSRGRVSRSKVLMDMKQYNFCTRIALQSYCKYFLFYVALPLWCNVKLEGVTYDLLGIGPAGGAIYSCNQALCYVPNKPTDTGHLTAILTHAYSKHSVSSIQHLDKIPVFKCHP